MEVSKIFNGKMNSDVSEYQLPAGDYMYALNIRIGSTNGQNIGTITNVRGNTEIPIPDELAYLFDISSPPPAVFKMTLDERAIPYTDGNFNLGMGPTDIPVVELYQNGSSKYRMPAGSRFRLIGFSRTSSSGSNPMIVLTIKKDGQLVYMNSIAAGTFPSFVDYIGTAQSGSNYEASVVSYPNGLTFTPVNIPDSYTPITDSIIKTIGTVVSEDKKKVHFFVYRSDKLHSIVEYDISSQVISKIMANMVDTDNADVLHLSASHPVNHGNLIDSLLYWTDNYNEPRKINIDTAKSSGYGTISKIEIAAATVPPMAPIASYGIDSTKTINLLKKNLYQFRALFNYEDGERSVFSPASARDIPGNELTPAVNTDPTLNNKIDLSLDMGSVHVVSVEIIARYGTQDWFTVDVVNKIDAIQSGLYDATTNTYKYSFYNDGNYSTADQVEAALLFDYIPQVAKTQRLVNGNDLVYGNIVEGYDQVPVDGIIYTSTIFGGSIDTPGFVFKAWKSDSRYQFGIVYYDQYGRSGTVNTNPKFNVKIPPFDFNHGTLRVAPSWSLTSAPPSWAYSYQWVRTQNLTHKTWLFWRARVVTAVTQGTNNYYDIFLDTIESFNRANKSSTIAYQYTPGDRISVHRPDGSSAFIDSYDTDIVEFAVYTPPVPPATTSTDPLYRLRVVAKNGVTLSAGALIEVYTPSKSTPTGEDLNPYYEFGESYLITNPGTTSAAHSKVSGQFLKGDIYYKPRLIPNEAPNDDPAFSYTYTTEYVEDPSFSDFYVSNFSDNGRPNAIDKNNKRSRRTTAIRFSEEKLLGSTVNGLSRFYQLSVKEYDTINGDIQRLEVLGNRLITFQSLKTGAIPLNQSILEDQTGNQSVLISEELLNPIRYYAGDYGIGDHPEAFVRGKDYMYWLDPNRGVMLRLAGDGIDVISKQFSMDNFFSNILKKYADGNQMMNLGFDERFDECIVSFESENIDIFSGSETTWDLMNSTGAIDNSSEAISLSPTYGSLQITSTGGGANNTVIYTPATDYIGSDIFSFTFNDVFGNNLGPKNVCITVQNSSGRPTKWVGLNPVCYGTPPLKYYTNRGLYYTDVTPNEAVLVNGQPVVQLNYNPADPLTSKSDPKYIPESSDDCFCLGSCGGVINVTFTSYLTTAVIINNTDVIHYGESKTYPVGGITYTVRSNNPDPAPHVIRVYTCTCPTPPGCSFFTMQSNTDRSFFVANGQSVILSPDPTVPTLPC